MYTCGQSGDVMAPDSTARKRCAKIIAWSLKPGQTRGTKRVRGKRCLYGLNFIIVKPVFVYRYICWVDAKIIASSLNPGQTKGTKRVNSTSIYVMYVYIHTYLYIHIHAQITLPPLSLYWRTHLACAAWWGIPIDRHTHTHTHTHTNTHTHIYIYIYVCVCIWIYKYICKYIYTHTYIYIHR